MSQPLISIITICFNAESTIKRTLESVDNQCFDDYEHIIVDGASSDGTLTIIKEAPSTLRHIFSEPDNGLYDAMNKGISLSKGKYLIFLNAGDKFHGKDALRRIAHAIEENDLPGIVYGQTMIVDDQGSTLGPRHLQAPETLTLESFKNGMLVCHQAFIANRKIIGFYDIKYRFSADYDWCIQCLQHSRKNIYLGDEPLIDYLSEGVTTKNHRASLLERFKIMSFYFGFFPTVCRHAIFFYRNLKRKV